jgi:hypothetical protein
MEPLGSVFFTADPLTSQYRSHPRFVRALDRHENRHGHQGTECPIEILQSQAGHCGG